MKLKSRARLRVVKKRLPSCMLRLQAVGGSSSLATPIPQLTGQSSVHMDGMGQVEVSEEHAALPCALACQHSSRHASVSTGAQQNCCRWQSRQNFWRQGTGCPAASSLLQAGAGCSKPASTQEGST